MRAAIRIGELSRDLETRRGELPDDRKFTKTETLEAAGIPISTANDYEQLHLSHRPPFRLSRREIVVQNFAWRFWGSFLRTVKHRIRWPKHFIQHAQSGIAVEKQLLQPL